MCLPLGSDPQPLFVRWDLKILGGCDRESNRMGGTFQSTGDSI